jgi:sporulation-control protein
VVFRMIKAALGVGVGVDSVLSGKTVTPGGTLSGEVKFTGGEADQKVEGITLEFTAMVELDHKGPDKKATFDFHRAQVSGPFQLTAGTSHSVGFEIPVPWETPLSALAGRPLPGMTLGVSTELALDKAFDKGDLDPLTVEPLAVHTAALDAMDQLGFVFQATDLEAGTLPGSHMPFFQEIEYWPGGEFKDAFTEVELTFITNKSATDIVLQADDQGSPLSPGHDTYQRFTVANDDPGELAEIIRGELKQLAQRRGSAV